jgi:hypothetical protein
MEFKLELLRDLDVKVLRGWKWSFGEFGNLDGF